MQIDFGPLLPLLRDIDITEIMVNSWDSIFVEKSGVLAPVPQKFVDSRAYEELIQALVFSTGRDLKKTLMFDGQISGGTRFNLTLPPLSPRGPTLTLRKHSASTSTLEALVKRKSLTPKLAQFLSACVRGRLNLVVSGGTGTGKTTLLNALASVIPTNERLVTLEDTEELQFRHPNWVKLVTIKDGPQQTTIREALSNSLRMRPDRLVVGECRGGEAYDMLQAMNTGHDGSMTTIHANTAPDALARLESLCLMAAPEMPLRALRRQMVQALDLVIQLRRDKKGHRHVSEVMELSGMEGETLTRATLFQIPENKNSAEELRSTGLVPGFLKKLEERDVKLPVGFFDPQFTGQF